METEYKLLGLNRRESAIVISVGVRNKVVLIPLSERDLIELITNSAFTLENMRKAREGQS